MSGQRTIEERLAVHVIELWPPYFDCQECGEKALARECEGWPYYEDYLHPNAPNPGCGYVPVCSACVPKVLARFQVACIVCGQPGGANYVFSFTREQLQQARELGMTFRWTDWRGSPQAHKACVNDVVRWLGVKTAQNLALPFPREARWAIH